QFVHLKMMTIEKYCNLTDLSGINQSQWLICDVLLRDCEAEEDVISFVVANINVLKHINLAKMLMKKPTNLRSTSDSDGSKNDQETAHEERAGMYRVRLLLLEFYVRKGSKVLLS
ncbi:unnamed protein product, partial [Didymodactylos carnosus]